jgi:hypothetical protein
MLPKSRSECDSGFDRYSTRLNRQVERPQQRIAAERRAEELVDPAAQALDLDAVEDHQREHRQRERERRVHVGRGHAPPVMLMEDVLVDPRHDVDGQEVHRIEEEHEHERRERDRRHDLALAVVDAADLLVDEVDDELDERLAASTARPSWPCASRATENRTSGRR